MNRKYKTCMLIDDDQLDNFIHTKMIKMNHFAEKVVVSEDANTALKLLRSGEIKPDIIFLDIRMPIMDGFEFLDEYDKLSIDKKNTDIVVLSTSLNPADINRAEKNKYVKKYFTKSLTPEILMRLAS